AWSSMLIVDGRVYTQEQVGENEAVVCLDAESGHRVWEHEDKVRFWDGQSGAGPRATPAFVDGRLYTQGATGVLSCLEASDGKVVWTRNIADDSKAAVPMWGFSASPLVIDGLVITYAGGPDDKGLLAYRADNGEPAWSAPTGSVSYSSAQPLEVDGQRQVLILSDDGLLAVDAATGKEAWRYDAPAKGIWRAVQPGVIGPATVLIGSEDLGIVLLGVTPSGDGWNVEPRWTSKAMRPAYNDFVVQDGFLYGFDSNIFCCIDLETGKRKWKQGRYGHGQVVLLADQQLLLVTSETGEVVLLRATPDKHEELGTIAAIHGKTWNHPAVVGNRLFVRNDEEIAFYRLPPAE
ncbi:MAG TPA: PQQ-binding-like beta-propeller repeat protein, partial [Pirellulales bacterium]|nr:PQQ-binding-like beta-propeller repeat protein [Pirellulales bacterium]